MSEMVVWKADRQSAGTRAAVVPRKGALRALFDRAARQGQGGRGSRAALQLLAKAGRNH